ncbi:hypothetical protein CVT26_006769 [Gymnopilus dilepis]|uniref:Uncharacterized protein n=1 Tax=Gymnopilus dilepis TaxID=231916 RepID=A0A409W6S3_9AGAR|nr:hypothetical protein CVT26_006769 [Gymnopilus dilepis]
MASTNENTTSDWRRQAIKEKIAQNETAVENTKAYLQTLESQRYELLEALNSTSRIMTALSPEVLSEIFLIVCETGYSHSIPYQFRIGRVCRAWRRVAWSTPRLWCKISIRFHDKRYETQRILLEEWIKRSGSCPLELSLHTYFCISDRWDPPLDSTFRLLATTCHRWTKLSTSPYRSLALALKELSPHFPLLNDLQVTAHRPTEDPHLALWDFSSGTPRLRTLDVSDSIPGPQFGVNWAGLVKLTMKLSFRYRPSFEILSLLPSLKELDCHIERVNPDFNVNMIPSPNMPNLWYLNIVGHPKLIVSFLRLLVLPKLTKLSVSCDFVSSQALWTDAINELVERSASKLTDLYVSQINLTDEGQILRMLRKLSPILDSFELHTNSTFKLSDRFINELNLSLPSNQSRRDECLPNLTSFAYEGGVSVKLRTLLDMLESRERSKRPSEAYEEEEGEEDKSEDGEEESSEHSKDDRDDDDDKDNSITSAETEESDDIKTPPPPYSFSVFIRYTNLEWYKSVKPDKMKMFLDRVRWLKSEGVSLDLNWERPDDDYESSIWSELLLWNSTPLRLPGMDFTHVANHDNDSEWRQQAVKEMIATNQAALSQLKANIQGLERKHYELLEALNNESRIMTMLSNELLSEIFMLVCADQLDYHTKPMQFVLGRVCRPWRRIAWSIPRLWSTITICFDEKRSRNQVILFQDWIKRSRECALSLTLNSRYYAPHEPEIDFFKALLKTSYRWRKLSSWAFRNFALALEQCPSAFPLLTDLTLESGILPWQSDLSGWNFGSITPQLRSLRISSFKPLVSLGVNWGDLIELHTKFDLNYRPSMEVLGLLQSLQILECFIIESEPWTNPGTFPSHCFPSLTRLSITGKTHLAIFLLNLFTAPRLERLNFSCRTAHSETLWTNSIVEFVRRSACRLTILDVEQKSSADEISILDMLVKLSPHLKSFSLSCSKSFTLSNKTINFLNLSLPRNRRRPQERLPHLEKFSFRGCISFGLRTTLRMLKSRQRRGADDSEEENDDDRGYTSSEDDSGENDETTRNASAAKVRNLSSIADGYNPPASRFNFLYLNRSWHQAQNPNKMRDFHLKVDGYSVKGTVLCIEWDKPDSDDED